MSDSDASKKKPIGPKAKGEPPSPLQQWRNLIYGLLDEEGAPKKHRMTKKDRAFLEKEREKVDAAVDQEQRRLEAAEWQKAATEVRAAENALQEWTEGKKLSSERTQQLVKALDFILIEGDTYLATPQERELTLRLQTALTSEAATEPLTKQEQEEVACLRKELMELTVPDWRQKEVKRQTEGKPKHIN